MFDGIAADGYRRSFAALKRGGLFCAYVMTGTERSKRCARYVTKGTYVLLNAAHAFADFGQHQEGAPIDPGTAYAVLHLCIELAAALTRELPAA